MATYRVTNTQAAADTPSPGGCPVQSQGQWFKVAPGESLELWLTEAEAATLGTIDKIELTEL